MKKKDSFGILKRFTTKCTKSFSPFSFPFSIDSIFWIGDWILSVTHLKSQINRKRKRKWEKNFVRLVGNLSRIELFTRQLIFHFTIPLSNNSTNHRYCLDFYFYYNFIDIIFIHFRLDSFLGLVQANPLPRRLLTWKMGLDKTLLCYTVHYLVNILLAGWLLSLK